MVYLPFIDGLRGLAIIAVVGYHAFPGVMSGGFAGVDVFFVISGFLITSLVTSEISDGRFSLYRFLVRRTRRLLPAAFVCVAVVTVLATIILLPDALWYYGRSLLSFAGLYANFFFYYSGGYFSAPDLEKPLLHTWSLAAEDQFYLTWPLFLMLAAPLLSKRALVGVVLSGVATSLWFAEAEVAVDRAFAFFMLSTRAWELLGGAALALISTQLKFSRAGSEALSIAGVIAVIGSFFLLSPVSRFPGLSAVPACLGIAAIIAACLSHNVLLRQLLSCRPLVFAGLVSYSLYLWHWPLLALASYRLERPLHASEAAHIVVVSVIAAVISWRWIERPFRTSRPADGARDPFDLKFVATALSCLLIMAVAGGAIKAMRGWPERFGPEARRVLNQLVAGNPHRKACDMLENVFANDGICNFGKRRPAGASYEIALFGDSMGDHWAPLVAKYAEDHHLSGRQVTNGGCALLFGVALPAEDEDKTQECAAYQREAMKFIERNPGLKIAVISNYWEKWLFRVNAAAAAKGKGADQSSRPAALDFEQALKETVRTFTGHGIKVVMIGQIPSYGGLPVRCIISAVESHRDVSNCGMSKMEAVDSLKRSNDALTRVAARNPRVSLSLPVEFMCGEERCSPIMDGVLLYKNGGHVNQYGSQLLGRFVKFPSIGEEPSLPPS
ncbi:acyltransferase family protein [Hyphomicrobium sp.]|uniref:acyltransferase family protein n=1 Tax=Hyphomicrobium sp. TaxID=82 RepID=UPI002D791A88|nr:acyltransferase family protein [Hyphomicrobium sp.]HET6389376.1 acyltransferase family protein [Hyphomicrobium sp.]